MSGSKWRMNEFPFELVNQQCWVYRNFRHGYARFPLATKQFNSYFAPTYYFSIKTIFFFEKPTYLPIKRSHFYLSFKLLKTSIYY